MTGGMAFVYDPFSEFDKYVNSETVIWQKPETKYWIDLLKNIIKEYWNETKSVIAAEILNNFDNEIHNFQQVCPIEMLEKLENPITTKTIKAVG